MPSEHMAGTASALTGTAGSTRKETCRTCNCTVYVVTVDGKPVITDSELITVVPAGRSPRSKARTSERVTARRLHAESCERRAREAALERDRARIADWEAKQPAKRAKLAALTIEKLDRLADTLRGEVVTAQSALRRVAQAVSASTGGGRKRGTRTRGM
jgi:hypothetical protein